MTMNDNSLLAQERPGVLRFGGVRMALLDVEAGFWALRCQMEALVGPRLADAVLQRAGANGGASFARAFVGRGDAGRGNGEHDSASLLRECIAAYQAAGFGQFDVLESEWPLGRVLVRGQDAFEAWATRQHGGPVEGPVCAYTAGVLVGFVNVVAGRRDVVCVERTCQARGDRDCLFELLPADAADDDPAVAFAPDPALGRQLRREEQEQLEESERRRRVAEGLRGVLSILNSDRPLHDILDYILEQARELLGAQGAVVYRLALEEARIDVAAALGMPAEFGEIETLPYVETEPNRATLEGQPFAISDVQARWASLKREEAEQDPAIRKWISIVGQHFSAYVSAPILVQDRSFGAVSLFYQRPHTFSAEEIQLTTAFADQAALAIENARLRTQAQEAAVAAERTRLARDLHDAVTQTLFSSSLIADVLPRLWERNPEEGQRRLAELRELTRGALAEMRTLLLELRPAALIEARLSDLLRQLAESVTGRARVPVRLEVEGDCELDAEVKVALYRIAQEALNNVAKHAGASEAIVRLHCQPGQVELGVCDDGFGFEPAGLPPDSLGLGIMRERALAIGAELTVESQAGQGTEIRVAWPAPEGR
jgi:signal transduction histidine kinase